MACFPGINGRFLCSVAVAALARLPAAEVEIGDAAEFNKIIAPNAKLKKLAGDMKFTEGPVWLAQDGGYLVFSDIPANELKQWTAKDGLTTFRQPSQNANGNTLDRAGPVGHLRAQRSAREHSGKGRHAAHARGSVRRQEVQLAE